MWTALVSCAAFKRRKRGDRIARGLIKHGILFDTDSDLILFRSISEANEFASLFDMEGRSIAQEGIMHISIEIEPMDLFETEISNAFVALVRRYRTIATLQVRIRRGVDDIEVGKLGLEVLLNRLTDIQENRLNRSIENAMAGCAVVAGEDDWEVPALQVMFRGT